MSSRLISIRDVRGHNGSNATYYVMPNAGSVQAGMIIPTEYWMSSEIKASGKVGKGIKKIEYLDKDWSDRIKSGCGFGIKVWSKGVQNGR